MDGADRKQDQIKIENLLNHEPDACEEVSAPQPDHVLLQPSDTPGRKRAHELVSEITRRQSDSQEHIGTSGTVRKKHKASAAEDSADSRRSTRVGEFGDSAESVRNRPAGSSKALVRRRSSPLTKGGQLRAGIGGSPLRSSKYFVDQVEKMWNSLPTSLQHALLGFTLFRDSFSVDGAVAIYKWLKGSEETKSRNDLLNDLTDCGMLILNSSTYRLEMNERVHNFLVKKQEGAGVDMKGATEAFVSFMLNELTHIEGLSRKSDSMKSYSTGTSRFEQERSNILFAFELARDMPKFNNIWLTGSYLLRYTLDAESRLKIYSRAIEVFSKTCGGGSNTREKRLYSARLLFAFARAQIDGLNYADAMAPLLAAGRVLQGLGETAKSQEEKRELKFEISVVDQNLARVYNEVGKHEEALFHAKKSLRVREGNKEAGSVPYALCLGVVAETLMHIGDYENSEKEFLRQLRMLEINGMENSREYANALAHLGHMMTNQKRFQGAKKTLISALEHLQKCTLPYKNYEYLEGQILQVGVPELPATMPLKRNQGLRTK
uniref:MalT-like TPR region domain-containing protein n=1 Tax=Rhodosorus marinus TaxID=101924 RepID=A0A7S3EL91_9RHOD|mmetsp:Transcript_45186/g.175381  ORF Transcript_45186/g.175381 Transcript_45186/m.175381 type:complete len:549 (+) Transcript_45186:394-2040(+)